MMLKAKFAEEEDEYDTYDPFGEIDADGQDMKTVNFCDASQNQDTVSCASTISKQDDTINAEQPQSTGAAAEHSEKDLQKRFPNYGWLEIGQENDADLQCTYPDARNARLFGDIRVTKVTRPGKKRRYGDVTDATQISSTFQVRPEWWEPAVWWLEQTRWSKLGLAQPGMANKVKAMAT